jgi:hypothetical protein
VTEQVTFGAGRGVIERIIRYEGSKAVPICPGKCTLNRRQGVRKRRWESVS